jgi:hypothetical protein
LSTLYAIGCSHTRYCWPTYADILGQEYDKIENWGQSGFGNLAIMHRALEIAEQAGPEDTVIVQWTYPARFDFHKNGKGWYQGGNLTYNWDSIQQTINEYCFDPDSYEWHTETYVKLIKQYLDMNVGKFYMTASDFDVSKIVEFPDKEDSLPPLNIMKDFNIKHRKFVNVRPNSKSPLPDFDHHWTPKHHLKYLEHSGFTITEKMLQYTNKAESILDEITNWKQINQRMVEKGYVEGGDYGRF